MLSRTRPSLGYHPPVPLVELELPEDSAPLPAEVEAFLHVADARIDQFRHDHLIPGFVPSDFTLAYRGLRAVARAGLATGNAFCEWGSGFGVIASLAAMLGYRACGIEVEGPLVEAARGLARDFKIDVDLIQGSFVPEGGESIADRVEGFAWLIGDAGGGDPDVPEPDEFDVIFAYPWPGEEHVTRDLFERFAGAGALFLTYHGEEGLKLARKVSGKRRKRFGHG